MKSVRLVYQDCATCKWNLSMADIQKAADKLGLGAAKIIKDADNQGVTVPFFECDGKYADSLGQLAEKLGLSSKKQKDKVNEASAKAK